MAMVRAVLYEYSCKFTPLLVNTGNRLVNFWQKFGKQWELESVLKSKRTVIKSNSQKIPLLASSYHVHVASCNF
eukprot:COSAG05_NODE_8889_length_664_cov_1.084956_1_plen_74_part_00